MLRNLKAVVVVVAPASGVSLLNPGAGLEPKKITPYVDYHKDGYSLVNCILDDMLLHGDKHGDNKAAYQLESVSGVSIIRYSDMVKKLDQKPMTHSICYEFCRTVPHMSFFGIHNGRDCYCTPYFKQAAGDSSECDAPCDGDSTTMCGGKVKSSVFSMHLCDDAAGNLEKASAARDEAADALFGLVKLVAHKSQHMQSAAEELQAAFGKVGDSAATGQMQDAKKFAGELEAAHKAAHKLAEEMTALSAEPGKSLPETEEATSKLLSATVKAKASTKNLEQLMKQAVGVEGSGEKEMDKLYYPAMYFVDKKFQDVPSTCGGNAAAKPLVASKAECAAACEALGSLKCVGFQHYPDDKNLCILFSKVTVASYYTGCDKKAAFLQDTAPAPQCALKLAAFEGQSIKPDASGKCEGCLKEAKKADRCFK